MFSESHSKKLSIQNKKNILNHTYNLKKTFRIILTTLIIKKKHSESHNNEKEEHSESDCKPWN